MAPNPCARNFKGIFAVSSDFFCLREPAAALRGLANLSLSFRKSDLLMYTSPLISKVWGRSNFDRSLGICLIVIKFSNISSPVTPSPLDNPLINKPFS